MKAILTYHSIDPSRSPISVSRQAFDAHLRFLASGRVRVLSPTDLVAHPDDGDDAVAVTFDDGFVNIREPVDGLRQAGVPVTIFVVSQHVGASNTWGRPLDPGIPRLPLLDWDDLSRLVARGVAIEAHTRHHVALTSSSPAELDDELEGCRQDLLGRLGVESAHLAYPYGDVDDAVARRAARFFRFGHTTVFAPLVAGHHALRLPRLDMYYFQSPGALEAWGTAAFAARLAWIRARRAVRARLLGGWVPRAQPAPRVV